MSGGSSIAIGNELYRLARQLQDFTEAFHGGSRPLVQQLVPLAGEIAASVACVLKTSGDPAGTGRRNLSLLHGLATRLAELAEAALDDEP